MRSRSAAALSGKGPPEGSCPRGAPRHLSPACWRRGKGQWGSPLGYRLTAWSVQALPARVGHCPSCRAKYASRGDVLDRARYTNKNSVILTIDTEGPVL